MNRSVGRFWLAAIGVAGGWAVASAFLFPYGMLDLETDAERSRVWLLLLWTSGVMAVCFGAAGLLGYGGPIGFREVAEAGSLTRALAARRSARRVSTSFHANFAWWLIVTGILLIGIYFMAWGFANA